MTMSIMKLQPLRQAVWSAIVILRVATCEAADPPQCTADGSCGASHPSRSQAARSTANTSPKKRPDGAMDKSQRNPGPLECHTYMAPSTLGEDTNMGMYTGVPLEKNDVIRFPEIAVPLLFREWAEHPEGFTDGGLWERYIWEGSVVNLETYDDTDTEVSKAAFIPGIGCTVNAVMDLNNIESTHGSVYDTAGLHRSRDPGAGAFAPYHSSITNAVRSIPAGSELLAGYGTEWIPDIPGAQVTLDPQLDLADDFLRDEYIPFVQEHGDVLTDELKQALWEFTTDFPVYSQAMTNLPRFPWADVEAFLEQEALEQQASSEKVMPTVLGSAEDETDESEEEEEEASVVRHFIRQQYTRSLDWLQNHPNSYCQDHLRPDTSTIPQAGRGAFATRDLEKGSVVGYAPLIHVGTDGRALFHIEYTEVYQAGARHAFDLIINYSFGHANSSIVLTPYGGMVNYINHGSTSTGQANVAVRFPNKTLVAHRPEWLHKTPHEFFHHAVEKIGLSFEYVALRDIAQGEEVLMDYGPDWEVAWEQHVRHWEPHSSDAPYVHSSEWDEDYLRTMSELESNPYPDNLHTMCISSYGSNGEDYVFVPLLDPETSKRAYCDVLERAWDEEAASYAYDVELRVGNDDEWIVVRNVPPHAIFLTDKSFTADWHLPTAFRHSIAIPDDIMPTAWLNGPDPFEMPLDDEAPPRSQRAYKQY